MRSFSSINKTTLLWLILAVAGLLISCSANDPFDPESVRNNKPTVRMFVTPHAEGAELNPTSYFERTFNWSGSDNDGWVTEYYVSIRTQADIPAPWVATTSEDTTMTFGTNENGVSEATFYIACKDNRGAYSDTLVQYIPLRNFPPTLNFQADFEPLRNMQREFSNGGADTTYWNFGYCNFRFFALDEDGESTMDTFYRYTLMDISESDPEITFDLDDPAADPELGWIKVPFESGQIKNFEILVVGASPSPNKTLTLSLIDEALADTRFTYSWEVRAPKSRVLYIPDNSSTVCKAFYSDFMDELYGEGQWDEYLFWYGFPDSDFTLLESMRLFDVVLWTDGGSTSSIMDIASDRDGALQELVMPTDGAEPGKFMFISKAVAGNDSGLSSAFTITVLRISPSGSPESTLGMSLGKQALGQASHLPNITTIDDFGGGIGLVMETGTEKLYQMEYCVRCYTDRRPPWDPIVGVRWPGRDIDPLATVVTVSIQLEYFDEAEAFAALEAIINDEFGVVTP